MKKTIYDIKLIDKLLEGIYEVKNRDNYDDAVKEAVDFINSNDEYLTSLLSFPFFGVLDHEFNPYKPNVIYNPSVFNEDVEILDILNSYNSKTNKVCGPLKACFERLLAEKNTATKTRVTVNQLLKGLIDLYGYITIDDLNRILQDGYDLHIGIDKVHQYLKENLLINYTCKVTSEYVVRREIEDAIDEILANRHEFCANTDYKVFNKVMVYLYANAFNFTGIVNLKDDKEVSLFTQKVRQQNILPIVDDENKNADHEMPKWVLKGYSYNELKDTLITND